MSASMKSACAGNVGYINRTGPIAFCYRYSSATKSYQPLLGLLSHKLFYFIFSYLNLKLTRCSKLDETLNIAKTPCASEAINENEA